MFYNILFRIVLWGLGLRLRWLGNHNEKFRGKLTAQDFTMQIRTFTVRAARVTTVLQPGDVIVPTAQPWGNLAIYLLEPHSDDGLARWGHFDDVAPGQWFPVTRLLADPGPLPRARA